MIQEEPLRNQLAFWHDLFSEPSVLNTPPSNLPLTTFHRLPAIQRIWGETSIQLTPRCLPQVACHTNMRGNFNSAYPSPSSTGCLPYNEYEEKLPFSLSLVTFHRLPAIQRIWGKTSIQLTPHHLPQAACHRTSIQLTPLHLSQAACHTTNMRRNFHPA